MRTGAAGVDINELRRWQVGGGAQNSISQKVNSYHFCISRSAIACGISACENVDSCQVNFAVDSALCLRRATCLWRRSSSVLVIACYHASFQSMAVSLGHTPHPHPRGSNPTNPAGDGALQSQRPKGQRPGPGCGTWPSISDSLRRGSGLGAGVEAGS